MNDEKLQKLFALASNNANLNEASVAALKFVKALQKSGKPININFGESKLYTEQQVRKVADNAYNKSKMPIQPAFGTKDLNPKEVEQNQHISSVLSSLYKKWGYEEGFNEGKLQQKTAYNNGFSNGYSVGKSEGYNIGLQENINKQHINNNNIVYSNQSATATIKVDSNSTGRITFNGNSRKNC